MLKDKKHINNNNGLALETKTHKFVHDKNEKKTTKNNKMNSENAP